MRILVIVFNQIGKGTFQRALWLSRGLARRGHDVTVLGTALKRRVGCVAWPDSQPGVTVVEAPDMLSGRLRSGWDPWGTLARIDCVRRLRFDLVYAFESRPVVIFPALYVHLRRHVPLVMDWCDWFGRGGSVEERSGWLLRTVLRPVETFFEETFRKRADGTTVINSVLRRRAVSLGVRPETILDLPNGCDVDAFQQVPLVRARQMLGLPQAVPLIAYTGATFERDAALMAEAFDRVRQSEPAAELVLVGSCNAMIEKLVADPGAVRRTGFLTDEAFNQYLAACDLCWLPLCDSVANRGRSPQRLNYYMAAGRPVVATAVGDVGELVRRSGAGLAALPEPADLARQTLVLLRDPALRDSMGQRARGFAEAELTWDMMGGKLDVFCRRIVDGASSPAKA